VFAGFVVGLGYAELYDKVPQFGLGRPSIYWAMLVCTACLFVLGLVDDLRGVGVAGKFTVQIAAAAAVWAAGFRIDVLAFGPSTVPFHLGWLSLPVTVVWIVGITNAVNLIDGLDGLAAGTGLITAVAVAVMALLSGQTGVVAASAALVGGLLGFLPYNFNPARIFLGDSGSMLLGFVLAVISIRSNQKGPTAVAALATVLVLGLPILDTSLAIVRRTWKIGREGWKSGEGTRYVLRNSHRVFRPDRGHLHHRLLDLGLSHSRAVLALYALATTLAGLALLDVMFNSRLVAFLLLAVLAASVAGLSVTTHLARVQQRAREAANRAAVPAAGAAPGRARQGG
jgi:UDP-GlcNAc:undecaprenyl-phosphate/decaprenyl-phosphate GlcNAc-1-phosphate transferase